MSKEIENKNKREVDMSKYDKTRETLTKMVGEQFDKNFLSISPNNRIPAIVDKDGPDGRPIYLFESGAILYYLAKKTSSFMGNSEREQQETIKWLMWQMASFGPMLGQVHHFNHYAPVKINYAIERYMNEAARLYGVLDTQLSKSEYVAGKEYTIADIAILPWTKSYERQGIDLVNFPNIDRWRESLFKRKAVKKAYEIAENKQVDLRNLSGEEWRKLFGPCCFAPGLPLDIR